MLMRRFELWKQHCWGYINWNYCNGLWSVDQQIKVKENYHLMIKGLGRQRDSVYKSYVKIVGKSINESKCFQIFSFIYKLGENLQLRVVSTSCELCLTRRRLYFQKFCCSHNAKTTHCCRFFPILYIKLWIWSYMLWIMFFLCTNSRFYVQ